MASAIRGIILNLKYKAHLKSCHHCKTCKHPAHKKIGTSLKVDKMVDVFGQFQATRWG